MKLIKRKFRVSTKYPYLMVDYVTNAIQAPEGYKILKPDEWFLKYTGQKIPICWYASN